MKNGWTKAAVAAGALLWGLGCASEDPFAVEQAELVVQPEALHGTLEGAPIVLADLETVSGTRLGSQGFFELGTVDRSTHVSVGVCPIDELRQNPYVGEGGDGGAGPVLPEGAPRTGAGGDDPGLGALPIGCERPAWVSACADGRCVDMDPALTEMELVDDAEGRHLRVDAADQRGSELHLRLRYVERD
ncbi:MAG TPA: hypothetical protein RMH99_17445 [Sandaracinaceae bacterium LLY-WYZ-13_1]|nr:hypothetical protein [Sandaracinaceae bacterium LLY-WYZ-13_1]